MSSPHLQAAAVAASWRETFVLYEADDAESAWIRGQHIHAVLRLTPSLMAANVFSAAIVGHVVWAASPRLYLLWSAVLLFFVGTGLRGWWAVRLRPAASASRRAMRRSTLHAGVLGALWGAVPLLWFADTTPQAQLLLGTLTAGMMSAGAFALGPLPRASMAYVAGLLLGALGALALDGGVLSATIALLLLAYAAICVVGAMAAGRKATALLRSEREAARQRQIVTLLLRDFEEHAADALWETDTQGRLSHASAKLGEWLGVEPAALLGQPLERLLEERCQDCSRRVAETLARGLPFRELSLQIGSGEGTLWWQLSGKPAFDESGRVRGWRGVVVDVTATVQADQRLRQLAHFDSLTGLANRVTLHDALRAHLASGRGGALLSMDLDHFKAINDTLGHSTGDAVLVSVAERLRSCVRPADLVARLGGDEFAVLLPAPIGGDEVLVLAKRMVASFTAPCVIGGRALRVGLSVGAVLMPEHGANVDELLVNADLALYDAKEAGRGRASLYAARLGERSRRRAEIEQALKQAVAEGQLTLHWQPQVDLKTWRIVGAEALMRWEHPQLGHVAPGEFIGVAEQSGAIVELGAWALREACQAAVRGMPGLTISVNVSAAQLSSGDFAAVVQDALEASGLERRRLELELTESIFIDDVEAAMAQLRRLQRLGVRIALDDFGTGYSSLAYLRRFPFDTLKIDRAFVRELPLREDTQAIVAAMVQLAAALGMRVVAEGVEKLDELDRVVMLGCHEVQGFLVSQPRPEADFQHLCRSWVERRPLAQALH